MNPHIIIERRSRDWVATTAVVIGECVVMFLLGYFARPVIQTWIGGGAWTIRPRMSTRAA